MNGGIDMTGRSDRCQEYMGRFQEYLDGTMPKQVSLELFLHVRECRTCREYLEETKQVFQLLDSLPQIPVPARFNEKILSAVPYQTYKEMAPLRQERLPVFLEEGFLPAPVRSATTRIAGGSLALFAAGGMAFAWLPTAATVIVVTGLLPEILVRLQSAARHLVLVVQKSQSH